MSRLISALLLSLLSVVASASAINLGSVRVDSHDNLFYTDWGHWFTQPSDHGLAEPGSQAAAAAPFNFSGYSSILLTASGLAVEDVDAAFDPDGNCVSNCETGIFPGTELRAPGLPVYSLIGIWSRSATAIDPFYTTANGWQDLSSGLGLLLIGSQRELFVPDSPAAYLFLAVNDGGFADNSGGFDVNIAANVVPIPAAWGLMLTSLLMLVGARRRSK